MDNERFAVTHTEEGLWSVSRNDRLLAVHATEAEALKHMFGLASHARLSGGDVAVVLTQVPRGIHHLVPRGMRPGTSHPVGTGVAMAE